jgi:hypothetical protein
LVQVLQEPASQVTFPLPIPVQWGQAWWLGAFPALVAQGRRVAQEQVL